MSDNCGFSYNVIRFDADMRIWAHLWILTIRRKKTLILCEGLTQELDDTTLTVEAEYPINVSEQENKFCLILHYNGTNSCLIVKEIKIYQFKSKRFWVKWTFMKFGKYFKHFYCW